MYRSWLFFLIVLITLGVMIMASAEFTVSMKVSGDPSRALVKIFVKVIVSFMFFLLFSFIKFEAHERFYLHYYTLALVFLALVLVAGGKIAGTRRWIYFDGFSFQPSEFAKLAMIIFLAKYIKDNEENLKSFYHGILKPLFFVSPIVFLVFVEPDLSTSVIMFLVAVLMLYSRGARLSHVLFLFLTLILIFLLMYIFHVFRPYQIERLKTFFERNVHEQVLLALKSMKEGGLLGKGLGVGEMKRLVPVSQSDFILAIIGEELGFLGVLAVLFSYVGLVWSLLFGMEKVFKDTFQRSFVEGFSYLIILQVVVNLGVNVGLLPVTGVTLPFVSQGGSSFLAFMMGMGMVVSLFYGREEEQE